MTHTYPIAEIFHSIQGEGTWTGTPMAFVRFAGCCVGRAPEPGSAFFTVINAWMLAHTVCESVLGEKFICDTDYQMTRKMTVDEIVEAIKDAPRVCLTGGEPFMYDLDPLISQMHQNGVQVHIETSGAARARFSRWMSASSGRRTWVTVSPKRGFLFANPPWVDEFKFVVSSPDLLGGLSGIIQGIERVTKDFSHAPIFIQPINDLDGIDAGSLATVLEILKKRPQWRLSLQLHKIIGVR